MDALNKGYSFESVLLTFKDGSTSLLEARDDTRYVSVPSSLLANDQLVIFRWSDEEKPCVFVVERADLRSVLGVDERSEG